MKIRVNVSRDLIDRTLSHNQRHHGSHAIVMALKAAIDSHFGHDCKVSYPVTEEDGRVAKEVVRILVPESKDVLKIWRASVPAAVDDTYWRWISGSPPNPFEFDLTLHP